MNKLFRNSLVLATLALGVVPSTGLAAPDKKNCDAADPFDRLVCRQGALAEQMDYTANVAFGEGTELSKKLDQAQIKQLRNANNQAQRAAHKHDKNFFKRQAKAESRGNKQLGHLLPFDPDADDVIPPEGDGICDYEQGNDNAQCAAIELGPDGDLQPCNPEKKNKGKGKGQGNGKFDGLECDRSIDAEDAETFEEAEDMTEAAEQLEAAYEVAEENLIEMNATLEIVNEEPVTAAPQLLRAAASECDVPASNPHLFAAAQALRITKASTFGAARVIVDVTGQVAFGFNARSAGVVFDGIAAAADLAFLAVDILRQEESAKLQNAIMTCVNASQLALAESQGQAANTDAKIDNLQQQVAALEATLRMLIGEVKNQMTQDHAAIEATDNANKDTIVNEVEQARSEVIELLKIPQGQREGFTGSSK